MGELAKREDSHATLMQVLETKEKKRKEKKIENKENDVLCLNFLFSFTAKVYFSANGGFVARRKERIGSEDFCAEESDVSAEESTDAFGKGK